MPFPIIIRATGTGNAAQSGEREVKVDDFAYKVSSRTMELLSELHHYKIPDELKKEVTARLMQELNEILKSLK